jgi:hypothetical protein
MLRHFFEVVPRTMKDCPLPIHRRIDPWNQVFEF